MITGRPSRTALFIAQCVLVLGGSGCTLFLSSPQQMITNMKVDDLVASDGGTFERARRLFISKALFGTCTIGAERLVESTKHFHGAVRHVGDTNLLAGRLGRAVERRVDEVTKVSIGLARSQSDQCRQ